MTGTQISPELIEKTTVFHGHWCPGLAVGIRAAELCLKEIGQAADEEVVALVETDMCGVDAIQYLTGCTFGKGNLIHKDYGKNAFTFYRRRDNKAVRMVARPTMYGETGKVLGDLHRKMLAEGLTEEEQKLWQDTRTQISKHIMDADLEELFDIKQVETPPPSKARILASLVCSTCGEPVMESKTRRMNDQVFCIPCFDVMDQKS